MSPQLTLLLITALSLGFVHTAIGPDHYLPFIVMSKVKRWSILKTAIITFLCGLGHILSSVALGFIGIALGIAVFKLEAIEAYRGDIAAWLLIIFGFTYFIWGLRQAVRRRPHHHAHNHEEDLHAHTHGHVEGHAHVHDAESKKTITPWVLFTIFVLGPCEPLIPLLMYPAAKGHMFHVFLVASVFGIATIATMLTVVIVSCLGLSRLPLGELERYSHALAGLAIFLCGGAIKFMGL